MLREWKPMLEELEEMMVKSINGSLYLEDQAGLTALPDGLTVGGSLNLFGCTGLTALPDGLTVGGSLNLSGCTGLTALPDGLTVGGSLYLSGCTGLTALPDGLTVGGSLNLSGCTGLKSKNWREKFRRLKDGEYVPGRYLYADGILTHVKRKIRLNGYEYFVGKIPGKNVVSDGKNFAHCSTFREGIEDLLFKAAKDRGAEQYKGLTLDCVLSLDEAKAMYRIITGACRAGTQAFVESLGDKVKDHYTVREMIDVTKGQFGASSFQEFFNA